jgi:predicted N-formylglutamate amidohydrolase
MRRHHLRMTDTLLFADEPPAFEVVDGRADSELVLLCDHASNRIPRSLGTLGLPEHELARHIAWDVGAAGLGRALARRLGAWLCLQSYSRLVIDANRRLDRPDSIPTRSEDTTIPGNESLSAGAAAARAREIFEPYHATIRAELDRRAAAGLRAVLVFVHSFTPVYRGTARAWHAGVLYHDDSRLALPMLHALRQEPGLVVGDNEPYAVTDVSDYGIVEHAEKRGLLHVELEVRQDLIATATGQEEWAERLARLLVSSVARVLGSAP